MSDAGAEVILVDVDDKGVQRLADTFRAEGRLASAYRLDVSQIEGCLQLAEEVGDIDVLINNAGLLKRIPFASASVYEAFAVTLAVNVHGPFNMTRAFLPALKDGVEILLILLLSSPLSPHQPHPPMPSLKARWRS